MANSRLKNLEHILKPKDENINVVLIWDENDAVTVGGVTMPFAEYEKLHPNDWVIDWGIDDKIRRHRRGAIVVDSATVAKNS